MRLFWLITLNVVLLVAVGVIGVEVTEGFDKTSVPVAVVFYGLVASLVGLIGYATYRRASGSRD